MKLYIYIVLLLLFSTNVIAQHDYVLVFYSKNYSSTDGELVRPVFDEHIEFLDSLSSINQNFKAYGTLESSESIVIFHHSDINKVRNIIEEDPLIKSGKYRSEYFHTNIRYGDFCNAETEELVKHNFIKYTSHITKFNVQHVPQLLKMHDDYLKKIKASGNVLIEGVFSNSDGGFLIMKGNLSPEVILSDPTYSTGFTIPEIHDIHMNRGFLCMN